MLVNILFTGLYLFFAALFGLMAWLRWFDFPALPLWIAAGICFIVGLWRLLHLSRG